MMVVMVVLPTIFLPFLYQVCMQWSKILGKPKLYKAMTDINAEISATLQQASAGIAHLMHG